MTELKSDDKLFSQIMKSSRLEMPYDDFDDNVMRRIEQEAVLKRSLTKSTKLSAFFFLLGAGFGLVINILLAQYNGVIGGIRAADMLLYFQVLYALAVISQMENLIKMVRRLREN